MATIAERINKAKQDNRKVNGKGTAAQSIEERIRMAKQDSAPVMGGTHSAPSGAAGTTSPVKGEEGGVRGAVGPVANKSYTWDEIEAGRGQSYSAFEQAEAQVNSALKPYNATLDTIVDILAGKHGAKQGSDGKWAFSNQKSFDAYNEEIGRLMPYFDSYNSAYETAKAWDTLADNYDAQGVLEREQKAYDDSYWEREAQWFAGHQEGGILGPTDEEAEVARKEAQGKWQADKARLDGAKSGIRGKKRYDTNKMYNAYVNEADFEKYSGQGATMNNPSAADARTMQEGEVANIVEFSRDNLDTAGTTDISGYKMPGDSLYGFMTENEVGIYNYLLAKKGKDQAQEYLDFLKDDLNARQGGAMAKYLLEIENPVERTLAIGAYGLGAGIDQFGSGVAQTFNIFSDEPLPTSSTQYASAAIREELPGFGRMLYDGTTTIGNMAPAMLVGGVTSPLVGSLTLGVSSTGNAYNQALRDGLDPDKAKVYSALVGASEATLQYALGGISKLGGVADDVLLAKALKLDKAYKRIAATGAIKIGSEIVEEEIQLFLEPLLKQIVFDVPYDAPNFDEIVETAVVTLLSTGTLEGGSILKSGKGTKNPSSAVSPEQLKAYAEVFRAAKKTMGQRGAAAIAENTDLTKSAPEYFKDFARAYNDGQKGERSDNPGSLSQEQYTAAFEAGQADAKAGDTDGTVVQVAEDAGVDWKDDYVKSMDQEVAKRIDQLGKDLGVCVRFVDVVRPVKGKNGIVGTADGQYEGNEILVEKNNPNPELFIAGHEFTHRMQDLSPETYNSFVQAVLADKAYFARGGTGTVEGAITAKIAQYKLKGEALTRETAIDELVADYAGHLLTNETYLDSFMESHKENRTMLEKLRDMFHEFSLTIKGALGNKAAIAEQKLTQMLESSTQSAQEIREGKVQKNTASDGSGVKYALKGHTKDGRPVYETDFGADVPIEERIKLFKERIETIFNLGAVTLKTDVKKIVVNGDKFTAQKNVYGDLARENGTTEFEAKINALYDMVDILEGTKFVPPANREPSYGTNVPPKNKAHKDVKYWYKFRTNIVFDGVGYEVTFNIRDKGRDGQYAYLVEFKKDGTTSASNTAVSGLLRSTPSPHKPKIAQNGAKYNTQNSESKKSLKTDTDLDDEINAIYQRGRAEGWTEEEMRDEVDLLVEQRLQEARYKYGVIPAGENPAREVQVPKKTADNQKVSQTVRTILEAKTTPDAAVPTIEELTANGDFSYEVYTDKQAMADSENTIRDKGYNSALMDWTKSVQEGEVSKSNTALGWALYNQAANAGDLKTAMSILTNMVGHQRNAAQAVQATRILKKMSPEAQLYGVQRSAQNLAEELKKRYGKDAPDIQVNEELARKYLEAGTDKEREEAMRNLYRDLGRQMPSRFIDKWNAWRYLAMLGNPRTHVRNVLGNAFFAPVVAAKNMTATAIEAVVSRVSGGKLERTKGAVGFGKQGRELLSAAWSDYESVADQVSSGGKYSDLDHSNQYIQEGRRIFKTRALEAARKGNSAALEAEDMWFSRPHYAYALAQYCKAHGISPEMLRAANEAQKNTATNGGKVRYSVKGNPYAGKSMATDSSVYTYNFLTSLEDMDVVEMPPLSDVKIDGIVDRDWVARLGTENAAKEGRAISDTVSAVVNRYTGREIRVSRNGLLHSLGAENINRLRTNARLSAIGGTIVKNAVPINALKDTNPQAKGTYAMVCLLKSGEKDVVAVVTVEQHTGDVTQLDFVDVTHAISGRLDKQKGDRWSSTRETGLNPATTISTISISDLLEIVKTTYQSILSDDVLTHLGEQRNPQGYYADKVKFSLKIEERPATATAPHVDRVLLDRARAYAIKEAQKATYRDTNAFSQTISELGRYRGNNKVKKGVGVALEGILPFRKTPANILVRGLEYSPLGLANGIKQAVWDVKRGNKTAAEAIDSISAGLTGTGLLALGAFLAAQGLVRGSGGDDEEKSEFEELQGHQAYALELPDGTSVTLDWLAPEVLPFFVGVNLWEQTASKGDGGVTMSDILTATANVTEPLLEMSCLQSLNDVFDAVGYASSDGLSALPSALASAATSYLTQGFPTILGQAERTGEDKRMTTYTEKNAFLTADMQYTVGRISARLPGWDYQQIPYIDAWGRTESTGNAAERAGNNLLNPAYTSTAETSPMEDELLRLYEQTGDGSVLPSRAAKYFNVDGERKDLTAQEYVKYAQAKGQTAYKVLTALSGSEAYRNMSDTEKVEAVGLVYDYANATAKTKVSGYKPEGWIAKAVKTEKATGVKAEQYVTLYLAQKGIESLKEADGDTIANSKSLLVMEMVYNVKGLTDAQRRALFEDFGVGKTVIGWNKALVQEKLKAMRNKAA